MVAIISGSNQFCLSLAPPSIPRSVSGNTITSISATLQWNQPMTTYGQMYRFNISCTESYTRQYQLLASSLASNTRTYTLTYLQPGAYYECCVWAVNNAGSNRDCIGIEALESGA